MRKEKTAKNKAKITNNSFVLFSLLFVLLFASCSPFLGGDLETWREKAAEANGTKKTEITVPGATLAAKLYWLQANAVGGVDYTVEVSADEDINPHTFFYGERTNIGVTLRGVAAEGTGARRVIGLLSNGTLFRVDSGVTLVLDNNITLQGRSSNNDSLVRVNQGGMLVMNDGAKISGNTAGNGGGVGVQGGTFTMNGGEISGNTAGSGGGVGVQGGTFTMNGGEISGNTADNGGGGVGVGYDGIFTMNGGEISGNTAGGSGGVYVGDGTFTMNSGEISGNTADNGGGGVGVGYDGIFTMEGGEISGNTADNGGGGVYVGSYGTFIMTNGIISGNTSSYGGGVCLELNRTFTMEGGTISGNTADSVGGGVFVFVGTFTMSGGEISGNTASSGGGVFAVGTFTMNGGIISGNTADNGGGVYVEYDRTFTMEGGEISGNTASTSGGGVNVGGGTFTKTGGTIYGYSAGNANSNMVKDGSGTVVNYMGHAVYVDNDIRKETTAGPEVNLFYNNNTGSFSGGWDTATSTYLANELARLQSDAVSNGSYILEINADENIDPHTLSYSGRSNITITLRGVGSNRTLGLLSFGCMFTVDSGVTLVLDSNITLRGRSNNNNSLVRVNADGTLVMNEGAKISGNSSSSSSGGGGVSVSGGTFTMSGGEISGNSSSRGGGVYVGGGTFTMEDGVISGNTPPSWFPYDDGIGGGGVNVSGGIFTMNGGEISGNTAVSDFFSFEYGGGGGVYVYYGTFTKTGGTIYGYDAGDTVNSNVVKGENLNVVNDRGHAVYAGSSQRRETTAGPEVDMDSAIDGAEGGWDA